MSTWIVLLACRPEPGGVTVGLPSDLGDDEPPAEVIVDATVIVANAADLAALEGVSVITGDLRIEETALRSVVLPDLREIGGHLVLWENDALATVTFVSLQTVGGDLSLYDDPLLASLDGFSALQAVGGTLSVNRMPAVVDLGGLEGLQTAGAVYLFHDVALRTTDALETLHTVDGGVDLWELYALEEVSFPALATIGGRLDLFEADLLTAITLPVLQSLGGYELHECGAMTDVGAFPALTAITNDLTVQYDDALVSLAGFAGLRSVGALTLRFDDALTTLSDLSSLTAVARAVDLNHLDGISSLDLPVLATVGSLFVDHDDALVEPGLPALTTVAGDVEVFDNAALSHCALEALFDDLVIGGTVTCGANLDDGCQTWCLP